VKRARTSRSRDSAPASPREPAPASGESSPALLASYDPASSSWKTSALSLFEASVEFSETWPRSGMMRTGRLFERPTWALRTGVSESSSSPTWPTPDAGLFNDGQSVEAWAARKERELEKGYNGNGGETTLAMAVRLRWPTATAGDAKSAGSRNLEGSKAHPGVSLTDAVLHGNSTTARRPEWATPLERDSRGPNRGVNAEGGAPLSEQVLWPTPMSYGHGDGSRPPGLTKLDVAAREMYPGTSRGGAATAKLWPTTSCSDDRGGRAPDPKRGPAPGLVTAVKGWPTPSATDEKGPQTRSPGKERPLSDEKLSTIVATTTTGKLNAAWVCCLMGFPPGWAELDGPPVRAKPSTSGSHRARLRDRLRTGPPSSAPTVTPSSPKLPKR
jgi:hypothetical protein